MLLREAPRSYKKGQCWLGPRVGRGPGLRGVRFEVSGGPPTPPPSQLPPDAKVKKIHKDSFSALALSAFVCKNVAF